METNESKINIENNIFKGVVWDAKAFLKINDPVGEKGTELG